MSGVGKILGSNNSQQYSKGINPIKYKKVASGREIGKFCVNGIEIQNQHDWKRGELSREHCYKNTKMK